MSHVQLKKIEAQPLGEKSLFCNKVNRWIISRIFNFLWHCFFIISLIGYLTWFLGSHLDAHIANANFQFNNYFA